MADNYTTQTLRQTLFETIEAVKSGRIEHRDAQAIVKLSGEIIKTADLEIRYAQTCSQLDKEDTGINPGPILLADKTEGK